MSEEYLPNQIRNKVVIVAPLDWGMGHTTRCIPIIRQLLSQECKVIFAGNDLQINLIDKDFPGLHTEQIQGYEVRLDSRSSTYRQMLSQFWSIRNTSKQECLIANELAEKHKADIVLSDNRYGFCAKSTINIILTHQLSPQLPFFQKSVRKLIAKYIDRFDYCWIPDRKENPLCGKLIQGKLSIPVIHIGLLSRFKPQKMPIVYDYLGIVSGPEPERSRFQELLYKTLVSSEKNFKIVSPNPTGWDESVVNPASRELELLLNQSEVVITRAGYTSIMELICLSKKGILVPTEGQYEQLYLAEELKHELIHFVPEDQLGNCV